MSSRNQIQLVQNILLVTVPRDKAPLCIRQAVSYYYYIEVGLRYGICSKEIRSIGHLQLNFE